MEDNMTIRKNRGNAYFDTYYIYDKSGNLAGIIEDHCRGVKSRYFVGWKLDKPSKLAGSNTGKTESFDTEEEAMIYSVGEIVKR
jgi:hypothetical protein